MRPINRGDSPKLKLNHYKDAAPELIKMFGTYCSYCEIELPNPHVEHIQPKSLEPNLENEWTNFLLACPSCNSIKSNKPINSQNLTDYFWPDRDNTYLAFIFEKNRAPQVSASLGVEQKQIAKNTLELTGIDREPTHPNFNFKTDKRWPKRLDAWAKAEKAKKNLEEIPLDQMRSQIIDTATSTGFWTIWMTVFQDDANMRSRLIKAFQGTSAECFDDNTQPISPRKGGKI